MAIGPVLRRFETTIYKYKDPQTDVVQVPAAATIDFYRQGATVSSNPGVNVPVAPHQVVVEVFNRGALMPGDDVTAWRVPFGSLYDYQLLAGAPSLRVLASPDPQVEDDDPNRIYLRSNGSQSLFLEQLDRLVVMTRRPNAFPDPTGSTGPAPGSSITTSGADGRGFCYLRQLRFDYVVTITGGPVRLHIDAVGSVAMRTR